MKVIKLQKKMSPAEKFAWQYIQNHSDEIAGLSISKVSELANVSTATIVRAVKKKGFSGYTEIKQSLIEQNKKSYSYFEKVDSEIKKAILKNEYEMNNTLKMLETSKIEEAVQYIKKAQKVYIFARGFSELVGQEMQVKLELVNKNCEMHTDPNIIKSISKRITSENVLILISLNGETEELITAAQNVYHNQTKIILITTNDQGTLMKYADLACVGFKSDTSFFPEYEVRSRLPLQVISRILLDAYVIRTQDMSLNKK